MDNFENLGVYDLRNYARSVGVNSPTSKRKNQLIEEIKYILENKKILFKGSNRGRKAKDVPLKFNEKICEEIKCILSMI